jgi:threonine dehydrogenase-like Zn-dependent dehydrogenase
MELGITLVGCGQAPVQKCKFWRSYLRKKKEKQCANSTRADWKELLEMVENEEVDPTIMVTHRFRLEDIDKAYRLQEKRAQGLVKCFVETRFSGKRADGTPELTSL